MKLIITEKQLELLLSKNIEMEEQDMGGETTSSSYPEVGKWESGVTRGTANQIGVTKWSDIVGSTLKRDKANQLK